MTEFVFRRDNTCLNKDTREEILLAEPDAERRSGEQPATPDAEAADAREPAQ